MGKSAAVSMPFQAETKRLLDLMIHSLYSNKEIFLRELISNSSDAIDKLRFEVAKNAELEASADEPAIVLSIDKDARTLTISDTGIGMTKQEVIDNVGTIARSGTRELAEKLQKNKDQASGELIGQFGVGFYSAFMVADKVTLVTKKLGKKQAIRWESAGDGEFTIQTGKRDSHGTTITLHLRSVKTSEEGAESDDKEGASTSTGNTEAGQDFTEDSVLRQIVTKYSDFVRYPIQLGDETINSMKAVWRKRASEVTEEEYHEFYKQLSYDWEPPLKRVVVRAEGRLDYQALLYIPSKSPMDVFHPSHKWGPTLYVKNVLIMDHCEDLLPRYLRFVKGVVDTSDLPLNVSREILQKHGELALMRKGLTKKVLSQLLTMKKNEPEDYKKFWSQFGPILKEGLATFGSEYRDKLVELLYFSSTTTVAATKDEPSEGKTALPEDNPQDKKVDNEKKTTLADYLERMIEGQEEIYYIVGDSAAVAGRSPHLEAFRRKNIEVLFMLDPIDEFVLQTLTEYQGKKLQSVTKGVPALGSEEEKKQQEENLEKQSGEYSGVLLHIEKQLAEDISKVRLSSRLTDSPVCLVSEDNALSPQLLRMLAQSGQEVPKQKRIIELNPDHPLCVRMKTIYKQDSSDSTLGGLTDLLYGLALLAEGSLPSDPAAFTKAVSQFAAPNAG